MLRSAPAKLATSHGRSGFGALRSGGIGRSRRHRTTLSRSCFSKHQFSQPQLLAILCLMRYEDWTFRETEVRLSEHGELRRARTGFGSWLHHALPLLATPPRTRLGARPRGAPAPTGVRRRTV